MNKKCPDCGKHIYTRFGHPIVQDAITGNWWSHKCGGTGEVDEVKEEYSEVSKLFNHWMSTEFTEGENVFDIMEGDNNAVPFYAGYKSRDEEINEAVKAEKDSCILDITEYVHEWKKRTYVETFISSILDGMIKKIRARNK